MNGRFTRSNATASAAIGRHSSITLVGVERTLLGPLFARAAEATKRLSLLRDPHAVALARALEGQRPTSTDTLAFGPVLRTWMIDRLVSGFLDDHPGGTVVELGAGLNTRFERIDNGRQRWFDLELPRVTTLRKELLPTSPRRIHIAASLCETSWLAHVVGRPPYLFVLEAVLAYLDATEIANLFTAIASCAPGAELIADMPRSGRYATGRWAFDLPRELELAHPGWRLVGTTRMLDAHVVQPRHPVVRLDGLSWMEALRGYQVARFACARLH